MSLGSDTTDAELSRQEWILERAAILQFDAGIPPDHALAMAIEMRVDYVVDRLKHD